MWIFDISLDDIIWQQAINSYRYVEQVWRQRSAPNDEFMLFQMLHVGLVDVSPRDRPFPMATRSMRYSAILAEKLWAIAERERLRV
jgi:hypothetical protein